jgi:hypothetical protein
MKNSAPYLERVINAGVRTSLYNGDVVSVESIKVFLVLIQDFRIIFAITWVSKRWYVPLYLGLRRSSPEFLLFFSRLTTSIPQFPHSMLLNRGLSGPSTAPLSASTRTLALCPMFAYTSKYCLFSHFTSSSSIPFPLQGWTRSTCVHRRKPANRSTHFKDVHSG